MKDNENSSVKVFLIVLLVVIIAILSIIILNTARKYIIINKYIEKDEQNKKLENVYAKIISDNLTTDVYIKDGVRISKCRADDCIRTQYMKNENSSILWILEDYDNGTKEARKEETSYSIGNLGTNTIFNTENFWEKLKQAWNSKIEQEEYNGMKCYKIIADKDTTFFVDVKTYNAVKRIDFNRETSFEIKPNIVKDEDINIDISQYTILGD